MTRAVPALLGVVAVAAAFYAGRRTAPARTEPRVEYRDRVVTVQAQQQATAHEEAHAVDTTTRTRTVYREGPIRYVERETTRADSTARRDNAASASITAAEHVTERVEVRTVTVPAPLPRWSLGASAGWAPELRLPSVPSRLSVDGAVRVVGPVWLTLGASATPTLSAPVVSAGLRVTW